MQFRQQKNELCQEFASAAARIHPQDSSVGNCGLVMLKKKIHIERKNIRNTLVILYNTYLHYTLFYPHQALNIYSVLN